MVGKTATTKREEGKKSRKESEEKVKVIAKRRSRGKWATLGLIE